MKARVAPGVHHVPETREVALRTQGVVERAGGAIALGRHQQVIGMLAGPAVEWPRHRGQSGQQRVVDVGSNRGRHPYGQGRGGQLVVRHEDEGGVHGGGRQRGLAPDQTTGQPVGDRSGAIVVFGAVSYGVH